MWVVIFQSWGRWSRRSWHVLVGNLHGNWGADISFRHFFPLIIIAQWQMGNGRACKYTACIEMRSWLQAETALKQSGVGFLDTSLAYVTPTSSQPGPESSKKIKMVISSGGKTQVWDMNSCKSSPRYRWMMEIVTIFESESFSTKIMEQLRGLLPPFPPRQVSIKRKKGGTEKKQLNCLNSCAGYE